MFYYLHGILEYNDGFTAVVDCGGVGFQCAISANTARAIGGAGSPVRLYTYLNVREDALELYGFAEPDEQRCFRLLIGVSGVGCKVALSILSALTPQRLALAIATGDAKALTTAPGVGAKLAQRILLELKDKMKSDLEPSDGTADITGPGELTDAASEAVNALMVLGYKQSEAAAAVAKCEDGLPVERIVKEALRLLVSR